MQSPTTPSDESYDDIQMFERPPSHAVKTISAQEQIDGADARIHAALLYRRQIPELAQENSSFFLKGLQYELASASPSKSYIAINK